MPSATRTLGDIQADEQQLRDRVARLVDDRRGLEVKIDIDGATDGLQERLSTVTRGIEKAGKQLEALADEHRAQIRLRYESGVNNLESEQDTIERSRAFEPENRVQPELAPHRKQALDGAMRTLDRCQSDDTMSSRAAVAMEAVVRHSDPAGTTARYISAVADPAYNSAFGKLLQFADTAAMRMSSEEQAAVQRVSQVEAERAMVDGTGASGGFAIPIAIDPTILLTSSGALNPIRSVADVREISTYTLRLVSADTPASTYAAELTEATDGSPTLVQPTITTAKGQSFIPFSIELGQDWVGLQMELLKLLSDGRDILDATAFLTGTGSNQPQGLFSGAGGLQTAQRIQTATTATTVIGDLYAVRQALNGTRFWPNATFVASPTAWDIFYRYVAQASTTDPLPFTQGRGGPFLGTPKVEWSTMASATTVTATKIAVVADWSGYVIADRIGSQVELIPHIFGGTSRYPTGQRGLYYFWRTGTAVAKPNAFRYLEVK